MAERERTLGKSRRFGLVIGIALTALGAILLWRGRPAGIWFLAVAGVFLITAVVAPRLLGPFERAWMTLARLLSVVTTTVILVLTYVIVISPVGLIMRALRRDPLGLRFGQEKASYWEEVPSDGPCSRPNVPY